MRSLKTVSTSSTNSATRKGGVLVVGAGEGIGGALVKRFKKEGYITGASRRSSDGLKFLTDGGHLDCSFDGFDARKESEVEAMFADFALKCDGNIDVVVYNIGANIKLPILETTKRKFEKVRVAGPNKMVR